MGTLQELGKNITECEVVDRLAEDLAKRWFAHRPNQSADYRGSRFQILLSQNLYDCHSGSRLPSSLIIMSIYCRAT